jgi:hypothetical protein
MICFWPWTGTGTVSGTSGTEQVGLELGGVGKASILPASVGKDTPCADHCLFPFSLVPFLLPLSYLCMQVN